MVPISKRIKTPLPTKLHPAVRKAIEGGELTIPGDKVPLSRLEVWDEAVDEARDLVIFKRDDGRLEENADRWAHSEPGRIYNGRRDSYLDGGLENGEYLTYSKNFVRYSRLGSGTIDRVTQNTNGDGRILHSHLDLNNPDQSFHISINSEGQPVDLPTNHHRELPPASTRNLPGVMSLAEALQNRKGPAKAIFLDKSLGLADFRLEQQEKIKSVMAQLSPQKRETLSEILEAARSTLPWELYHATVEATERAEKDEATALQVIRKHAGEWAAVESVPEMSAHGVTQNQVSYVSPQGLQLQTRQLNWDIDKKTNLPIADSVVIGAGPGGLASAYHLANTGARTLIFEAGSAGQAFSDDHARSVKALRTSVASTDILGSNWRGFRGHEASLHNQFPSIIAKVDQAQAEWKEVTGEDLQEKGKRDHSGPFETAFPRAGLYDHMQRIASGLSNHYPDTFLIERSPVKELKSVHDGLFQVTTHNGHKVLTRTLVPATGFVGAEGELARQLPVMKTLVESAPDKILALKDDSAELAQAPQIAHNLRELKAEGKLHQAVLANDRKLGSPDMRALLSHLPKGSRVGFVGGGESGVKGALEVARLNPDAFIDLYVSKPLEPYQTQVPAGHLGFSNIKGIRQHSDLPSKTFDILESTRFGSPITTASLGQLFALVAEGRVHIHNLGTHFNEKSIEAETVTTSVGSAIRVNFKTREVRESVQGERQSLANSGLLELTEQGPSQDLSVLFVSVGYDTEAAKTPDYLKDLVEQGLLSAEEGSLDSRIVTNSAGFAGDTADTALAGRAIQGWNTPEALAAHLPKREIPTDRLRDDLPHQGIKVSKTPRPQTLTADEVNEVLSTGARNTEVLDNLEELSAPSQLTTALTLPDATDDAVLAPQDPLRILNQMDRVLPQYLSPSEKELVRRGRDLMERIAELPEQV